MKYQSNKERWSLRKKNQRKAFKLQRKTSLGLSRHEEGRYNLFHNFGWTLTRFFERYVKKHANKKYSQQHLSNITTCSNSAPIPHGVHRSVPILQPDHNLALLTCIFESVKCSSWRFGPRTCLIPLEEYTTCNCFSFYLDKRPLFSESLSQRAVHRLSFKIIKIWDKEERLLCFGVSPLQGVNLSWQKVTYLNFIVWSHCLLLLYVNISFCFLSSPLKIIASHWDNKHALQQTPWLSNSWKAGSWNRNEVVTSHSFTWKLFNNIL